MYLNGPNAENVVKKSPAQPPLCAPFVPSQREGSSLFFPVFDVFESFERIPFAGILYFELRHCYIVSSWILFAKLENWSVIESSRVNYYTTAINVVL